MQPKNMTHLVAEAIDTIEWQKSCPSCGSKFNDTMSKLFGAFPMRVKAFKTRSMFCSDCQLIEDNRAKKRSDISELYWPMDDVKSYFSKHPPKQGDELIIYDTSGGTLSLMKGSNYALVTVVNGEHGKQKRIVIDQYSNGYSGQSFFRNGKNCFAPSGQVRLLPYHSVVGSLLEKETRKELRITPEELVEILGAKK